MCLRECRQKFKEIFKKYRDKNQALLPCLHFAQEKYGHLTEEVISFLAQELNLPRVKVYSVVTFYSMFTLEEQGEFVVRVCVSLPCYLKGAREILETIKEELNIEPYQTTADKRFTLEPVSCLGLCDIAPAMMINKEIYGNLTHKKVKEIIQRYKETE